MSSNRTVHAATQAQLVVVVIGLLLLVLVGGVPHGMRGATGGGGRVALVVVQVEAVVRVARVVAGITHASGVDGQAYCRKRQKGNDERT